MATIEVVHVGGRDVDGNRVAGTSNDTLTDCLVAPVSVAEARARASDGSRTLLDVYSPNVDAPVGPTDQLVIDGLSYEVEGEPERWRNARTGSAPGCVIHVSREVG